MSDTQFSPNSRSARKGLAVLVSGVGLALPLVVNQIPAAAEQPQPATQPAAPPAGPFTITAQTIAVPANGVQTADDLLSLLETSGRDLTSLRSDVRWTKKFGEIAGGDEMLIREGTLSFVSLPPATTASTTPAATAPTKPLRRFQIDFQTETVNDVRHTKPVIYVFDGEWYVERYPEQRQVFRRQVVAPGQSVDPLAIGEGVFPIPIGQQKSKILERFDATLLPPGDSFPDDKAPAALAQTYQLKLIPKRGTDEAKQFTSVRLWYRTTDLLPRMARTSDRDESTTEVFLTNVEINKPLPAGLFDITRPAGWEGDDKEYRRPTADE